MVRQTDGPERRPADDAGSGDRVLSVRAYPLCQRLSEPTQTAWGRYASISIVIVQVRTEHGHVGVGEVLARFAPRAYCALIDAALAPRIVGQDPADIPALWSSMRRALSGRACGVLVEAIAGIDIALWDIKGKAAGKPLWALIGDSQAPTVPVYAASVNWSDDASARAQIAQFRKAGFERIKIKIGHSPRQAARRAALARREAGDDIVLYADANWAYALDEAEYVGRALAGQGYAWFEEPLDPDDEDGYAVLAKRLDVPLAAGESNFTSGQAERLIDNGALGFIQPNVTRAGGVTHTLQTARHARSKGVRYAAHVGMSGIVCETAALHIAAAIGGGSMVECAMAENRFKSELADRQPGYRRGGHGGLDVPQAPGLGLEIDWDAVCAMVTP